MLITIQSRKGVSIEALVDKYEISKRTIYRDINALIEAGVPIYQRDDKQYSIMEGYHLPPLMITRDEASALLIAEKMMKKYPDESINKELSSLATKLRAVLRYADKDYLETIEKTTSIYTDTAKELGYELSNSLLVLQKAVADKSVLYIEYANRENQPSKRYVEPVGITQYGLGWHLIAWCRLKNEYRDFRLDRIKKYIITNELFEYRDNNPLEHYIYQLQKNNK